MTKLFVIFNPVARGEKARHVRRLLEARTNSHVVLAPTQSAGDATQLAARAVREGYSVVVAAGGDGTINEVVNGLGQADVALGVLPTGTVNVFARELGLPLDVEAAWSVVERGNTRQIDLGSAAANGTSRYFVQLAGAGFDARAVAQASWELKKKIGPLSYVWAGLSALNERPPLPAVFVGNGRLYGGEFVLFPAAQLDDGKLDVCVFENRGVWTMLRHAWAVWRGKHTQRAGVRYFQTASFTPDLDRVFPVELDGELAGQTPVTFSVIPRALRVIVP